MVQPHELKHTFKIKKQDDLDFMWDSINYILSQTGDPNYVNIKLSTGELQSAMVGGGVLAGAINPIIDQICMRGRGSFYLREYSFNDGLIIEYTIDM